jgi:hypothetical protein
MLAMSQYDTLSLFHHANVTEVISIATEQNKDNCIQPPVAVQDWSRHEQLGPLKSGHRL